MSDNVGISEGSGTSIAADEVVDATLGVTKVQYVKLMDGTLDGTAKAAIGANGLKVDGSAVTQPVSGAVSVSGTITARETSDTLLGVYYCQTGAHLVLAAADAATAGRWFLVNPIGSSVTVRLRRLRFMSQLGSALVAVTSPRLQMELFTFTGVPSGASITPGKRNSNDATNVASLRTANTGMAITVGAAIMAFFPVASATAVAYNTPAMYDWNPDVERDIILSPGQGLLFRQADAGTASDTRRYLTSIVWEEF